MQPDPLPRHPFLPLPHLQVLLPLATNFQVLLLLLLLLLLPRPQVVALLPLPFLHDLPPRPSIPPRLKR